MRKVLIVSCILFLLLFGGIAQAIQFNKVVIWKERFLRSVQFNINIDPRINFYTENGYSLGSELCEGQKFRIDKGISSGEWVGVGAWEGDPPIFWVDDLKNVGKITSIPVYELTLGGVGSIIHANVICESPKPENLDVKGADSLDGSTFAVTSEDKVNINFNEDLNCVFYVSEGGKIFNIDKTGMNLAVTNSLIITKTPVQPKIGLASMLTNEQISPQASTYMKLTINNDGEKDVNIKDISLNVNSQLLACTSTDLKPGESTECILYASPKDPSLVQAEVKYQYLMCGERQTKTESFSAGFIDVKPAECLNNSDCQGGYVCCAGKCHDSGKGMCSDVNADGMDEWIPSS